MASAQRNTQSSELTREDLKCQAIRGAQWLRHQLDMEPMTDDQTQRAEDNMENSCFICCNEWNRTNRFPRILSTCYWKTVCKTCFRVCLKDRYPPRCPFCQINLPWQFFQAFTYSRPAEPDPPEKRNSPRQADLERQILEKIRARNLAQHNPGPRSGASHNAQIRLSDSGNGEPCSSQIRSSGSQSAESNAELIAEADGAPGVDL